MSVALYVKSILASLYDGLGGVSTALRRRTQRILVLTYHRILPAPANGSPVQAGMYVEPATFTRHIEFLQRHFNVVPLAALYHHERAVELRDERPFVVLTFDDGWRDFYTNAFPILRAHRVPATVFLPTDLIGTQRSFWTDRLAYLYSRCHGSDGSPVSGRHETTINRLESLRGPSDRQTEAAIAVLKSIPQGAIEEILTELSSRWDVPLPVWDRSFLSWAEVRDMGGSGLIHYGSHTASHRILTISTPDEVREDLARSKDALERSAVVDPQFVPFSYPNGDYNDRVVALVKEAGYSLAVTTDPGWNNDPSERFLIRRISMHQDMTATDAMMGCRILGMV